MQSQPISALCSQLKFQGARNEGSPEEFNSPIYLPNQTSYHSLLSLDMGGTLAKLVYLSTDGKSCMKLTCEDSEAGQTSNQDSQGGHLKFLKYANEDIHDCLEFIGKELLHRGSRTCCSRGSTCRCAQIMATGGGALKCEDLWKDKLGCTFHRIDEIEAVAAGANFLLKKVHQEAFAYIDGRREFVHIDPVDMFPYLLVNIGTGVTCIKVTGEGNSDLFTGSAIGASTLLGTARLFTKCTSYDEFLELSQCGNSNTLDLTVGDLYGESGYLKYNIPASMVASCFGKINLNGDISLYNKKDIAASLLSGFIANVTQISCLAAMHLGIKRIVFGGSFVASSANIVERLSNGVDMCFKGKTQAIFLCHGGFLGALGALMNYGRSDVQSEADKMLNNAMLNESFNKAAEAPAIEDSTEKVTKLIESLPLSR